MHTGSLHIRFQSIDYDSGGYDVTVRFRELVARMSFYAARDCWHQFGQELRAFVPQPGATVSLQEHSLEGVFQLTAFSYNDQGHMALRVLLDDATIVPGPYRLEFAIPVDVAGLNRLGQQLASWPQLEADEFSWDAYAS